MAVKPKNKKLAALAPPRNKVTKKDVLVGRGVIEAKRGRKIKKKKSTKKKGSKPANPSLYARVKAEAKKKFKVYPSAYANAWLVRTYKKRGGGYK
jgi:hypothetical protein